MQLRALPLAFLLVTAGVALASGEVLPPQEEPPYSPRFAPDNWAAFVAGWGGMRGGSHARFPHFLVYRDHRAITGGGSGSWYDGQVPPAALARVQRLAERNGFFTLRVEPPRPRRQILNHGRFRVVGLASGRRTRVVEAYWLDIYGATPCADPLTRAAAEVYTAVADLRLGHVKPYVAPTIRVYVPRLDVSARADWPLPALPVHAYGSWGPYNYYSGEEARVILDALATRPSLHEVQWAPALSIPRPTAYAGPLTADDFAKVAPSGAPDPPRPTTVLRTVHVLAGHEDAVYAVAWRPDGKRLASASPSKEDPVRVWDPGSGKLLTRSIMSQVYGLDWRPDGKTVAVAAPGRAVVWDPNQDRIVMEDPYSFGVWTASVDWHPNTRRVAVGYRPGNVWHLGSKRRSEADIQHVAAATAWSPDGRLLGKTYLNGEVELCSAADGKRQRTLRSTLPWDLPLDLYYPLAWHPGSRLLAAPGVMDSTVRVWDVKTGNTWRLLRGRGPTVSALAWRPGGKHLACTNGDTAWLWEPSSGRRWTLPSEPRVYSLAWKPDGTELAAGRADGTVAIWRITRPAP